MIEMPEATVLAQQIAATLGGKKISNVTAARSPHKFAWYFGDPQEYRTLLAGKTIDGAAAYGGHLEISAGDTRIAFSDGVNLRYARSGEKPAAKHQLLLEFDDDSSLVGSVQMYGGLMAFRAGQNDNQYYLVAKEKPSPLSKRFDAAYFDSLFGESMNKLPLKAFLATEQRIPGLGNGVLQDILFNARLHPKKKVGTMSAADKGTLFESVRNTLAQMVVAGGRDTESDLFGRPGGYATRMSRNTAGQTCAVCGTPILKESYMGGSVYYCPACQTA